MARWIIGYNGEDITLDEKQELDEALQREVWTLYEFYDLESIIDRTLKRDFDTEETLWLLKISLVCIPDSPKIKPFMSMVAKMLQDECVVSDRIMRPGLITDVMDLKVRMVFFHGWIIVDWWCQVFFHGRCRGAPDCLTYLTSNKGRRLELCELCAGNTGQEHFICLWPKLPCLILQTSNADPFSLMDMLIFKAVEEQVKNRVEHKARIFEQNATDSECKVDPKVLSKLYDQWVMPQTKDVSLD
ncbi:hypothetical protein Zm00014a_029663 [Zea mays]|uniref:chorismate mutase n=1 Tax=Zea mays TaxID=4577 RepID=A0A317Y9J4_MAIZE|nr:hypothetical protein Zm00014a_029663 [Zea mays]